MLEDDEIIREFLIESNENLNRLDTEIVDLERTPTAERLASIFRTIHTIKGTCGFLGFHSLEGITHHAENILSQLRAGQRQVTGQIVSLILESVDAVRRILSNIEATGQEGDNAFPDLVARLEHAAADIPAVAPASSTASASIPMPDPAPAIPVFAKAPAEDPAAAPHAALPIDPDRTADKTGAVADSSIRVDVSLLDTLMNLVGELVLSRNQILQFTSQGEDSGLTAASQRLNLITSELQAGVMKTRMQPIGMIWNKLPRVVRDVAHSLGKQLELEMEGAETELDKTIIEAIKDPLTHLVRNAADHGIEDPETRLRKGKAAQGTLRLKAYHEGGQVNIEISDDGAGVELERVKRKAIEKGLIRAEQAAGLTDREALGLLFLPGFSTASAITNVSGRGVGMDVVKSNVEKIGGSVDISTKPGLGTTVKLKIPLTLAIIPGLLVTSGGHRFVIPQVSLLELVRLEGDGLDKIEFVHQTPVYRRRGNLLPIAYLNQVLQLSPNSARETCNIVVLQAEERQFGLVVDAVNDTQEIVVKPLGKQLKRLSCYSGSTILGDGAVALILDVLGLGQLSGVLNRTREAQRQTVPAVAPAELEKQRLLLFQCGSFDRLAVPLSLIARLEEIPLSAVERAGGRRVVQYRQQILPLISLASILDPGIPPPHAAVDDLLQVIVFTNGEQTVGLIVDRIIDIVEEVVTMRRSASPHPGILGCAVVGKKVADFLDLQSVLETAGEIFLATAVSRTTATVLLAEPSPFNRALLKSQLEVSGYQVIEAANVSDTLRRLERDPVQLLIVASELSGSDPAGIERLRKLTASAALPVLAISNTPAEIAACQTSGLAFDDHQLRFERRGMLESIARLARSVRHAPPPSAAHFESVGKLSHA